MSATLTAVWHGLGNNQMGAHSEVGRLTRGAMCSRRCGRCSSTPSGRGVPRPRSRTGLCSLSDVGDNVPAGWNTRSYHGGGWECP